MQTKDLENSLSENIANAKSILADHAISGLTLESARKLSGQLILANARAMAIVLELQKSYVQPTPTPTN